MQQQQQLLIEQLPEQKSPSGPVEFVSLTWHDRCKPRIKCRTESGTEIALALPRGTVLADGTLLYDSPQKSILAKAQLEEVILISTRNTREACVVAHHLGNWHRSLQVLDDGSILTERDEPLCTWLDKMNISFVCEKRSYHPDCRGDAH